MTSSKKSIEFSIAFGEIVSQGTVIDILVDDKLDDCQGPVTVLQDGKQFDVDFTTTKHIRVEDQTTKHSTTIHVPTKNLPPGNYNLKVDELLVGNVPHRLCDYCLAVAFQVRAGTLPRALNDYRVAHAVELAVGRTSTERLSPGEEAPSGTVYILFVKAVSKADGTLHEFEFDKNGNKVEGKRILAGVLSRQFEEFGRVHETLWHHVNSLLSQDPEKLVEIVVWPHLGEGYMTVDNSRDDSPQEVVHQQTYNKILGTKPSIAQGAERLGGQVRDSPDDHPYVHVTIPASKVNTLSKLDNVGGLFLDDQTYSDDLSNSIAVAKTDTATVSAQGGENVRVAVFEGSPSKWDNLSIVDRYDQNPPENEKTDHARVTYAIIKNTEPDRPHGHAPQCSLYAANRHKRDALNWAVSEKCTVINQSFHHGEGAKQGTLQEGDIYQDSLALKSPRPLIVHAAGNYGKEREHQGERSKPPSGDYVNHKGYNSLAVGSHDDSGTAMSGSSTFRNPATPHHDRELPELAANGTAVTANGLTKSGTSFAAPAVAGVAALLQKVNTDLKGCPVACRAILLASANRNVVGGTWWGDVSAGIDGKAGAGALDAECAVQIAEKKCNLNSDPVSSAWSLQSVNNDNPRRTHLVKVPVTTSAASKALVIKAALTWNSKLKTENDRLTDSVLEDDLDLVVRNNQGDVVAWSCSYDNSYEVVEFYAEPDSVYKLDVVRTSGSQSVYAIAWTAREAPWSLKRL